MNGLHGFAAARRALLVAALCVAPTAAFGQFTGIIFPTQSFSFVGSAFLTDLGPVDPTTMTFTVNASAGPLLNWGCIYQTIVVNPGPPVTTTITTTGSFSGTTSGSGTPPLPIGSSTGIANCVINMQIDGALMPVGPYSVVANIVDSANPSNSSSIPLAGGTITGHGTDLGITVTDGATVAIPGNAVTYTITASATGVPTQGFDSVGANVTDTFPAGLTGVTWTCVGANGGTCTASGSGNINDTVNIPGAGGRVTYTVHATVNPSAVGSLSNTATVTAPGTVVDVDPTNDSATDTDTLSPQADLSITVTDGLTSAVPGNAVVYTITASNAGPSNVTGANVVDSFPAFLTASWTCVGAGGGTCTASGSGNINSLANLPVGGSVTYTANVVINPTTIGSISNTATIVAPAGVTDPSPANNSATDTDTLTPQGDLAITVTDGVASAIPGGSITYTITANNIGPSAAIGATISDVFPAGLTTSWTSTTAGGASVTAGATGSGNLNATVNLPVGGSVTFTVPATISAALTGIITNTAVISAPGGFTETTPGNNAGTDTDTLTPQADLAITLDDGVTLAIPAGTVTYTITASNPGPSSANGAIVADAFPAVLTVSWTCVGAGGATCTPSGSGNINDTLVNMPPGGSVTYTALAQISAAATGTMTNTATVAAPAGVTDTNPANNSASDTDAFALYFSGPSATGTGTITVVVTGGGGTCSWVGPQLIGAPPGAAPVPPTTPFQGISFPEGLFDFGLTGCAVGSTVTVTITYPQPINGMSYWKYGPTAVNPSPHWYVFPATISGNTAVLTIADGGLGDDDFTANGTIDDQGGPGAGGPPVPTLSEWMLALLALMLLVFGVAAARRRSPQSMP